MKRGMWTVSVTLRVFLGIVASLFLLEMLILGLQSLTHRETRYAPRQQVELRDILHRSQLSRQEYDLLFHQTGLAPAAVDELRKKGDSGIETILQTQEGFFAEAQSHCSSLIGGRFTCEDLLRDENGEAAYPVPVAPLHPGDVLVSFSTHTMGWRHGHAGLVVDPKEERPVLEAVQLGENSYLAKSRHWSNYTNFAVLRVKDATASQRQRVADFAKKELDDVPYSLLPGIISPKDGPVEDGPGVHCAYLPWYAWKKAGDRDLDADGGQIVTVADLMESPEVEVVQVYGIDPDLVADRQCRA